MLHHVGTCITVEEKVERVRRRHRLLVVVGRAEKERAPTGGRGAEEKGRPRLVVAVDLAARRRVVVLHLVAVDLVAHRLVVVLLEEVQVAPLVEALHLAALLGEAQVAPLVEALRLVITVDLVARLRVAVVPGSAFGAPGHVRLSFACGLDTLERAVQRIAAVLPASSGSA